MKLYKEPTLADSICDLRIRKIKKTFFTQINTLIDWGEISRLIDKDYSKAFIIQEICLFYNILIGH